MAVSVLIRATEDADPSHAIIARGSVETCKVLDVPPAALPSKPDADIKRISVHRMALPTPWLSERAGAAVHLRELVCLDVPFMFAVKTLAARRAVRQPSMGKKRKVRPRQGAHVGLRRQQQSRQVRPSAAPVVAQLQSVGHSSRDMQSLFNSQQHCRMLAQCTPILRAASQLGQPWRPQTVHCSVLRSRPWTMRHCALALGR